MGLGRIPRLVVSILGHLGVTIRTPSIRHDVTWCEEDFRLRRQNGQEGTWEDMMLCNVRIAVVSAGCRKQPI